MDRHERIEVITERIDDAINHIIYEYEITLAELVGILEVLKYRIMSETDEEIVEDKLEGEE